MTYKQWNAVIMLIGTGLIGVWAAYDALSGAAGLGIADVAARLVWAIVAVIVFNIVAVIVLAIGVGIARREELKDERADERDQAVAARGMRNAYFVLSIGGLGCLILLALGVEPVAVVYALFGALMLAGATDPASRLYYYAIG